MTDDDEDTKPELAGASIPCPLCQASADAACWLCRGRGRVAGPRLEQWIVLGRPLVKPAEW